MLMCRLIVPQIKTLILENHNLGISVKEIVKIFNVSKSFVYKLIISKQIINKKQIKKNTLINDKKINNFVEKSLNNNGFTNIRSLIEPIKEKCGKMIKKTTLYKIVKKLKFSFKKAKFTKNVKNNFIDKKRENIQKQVKKEGIEKMLSIDETGFNTNICVNYGWSKKGKILHQSIGPTYKRISVICACDNTKIVKFTIIEGSAKTDDFVKFLNSFDSGDKYLFMDNASIHKAAIKKVNKNILFNAPYTPDFNPIENVFSIIKRDVRKNNNNNLLDSLKKNVTDAFNNFNNNNLNKIFNHVFNFINKYLTK